MAAADWTSWISLAGALAGVITGVVSASTAARASKRAEDDLRRLSDEAQAIAMDSSDIGTVGKYLFDDIGAVRVSDVVADDRVRRRTLSALSRLTGFISSETTTDGGEPASAAVEAQTLSGDLRTAREQIVAGEVWNGLALMRRHLEIVLRTSDPRLESARMGAGQLISAAARIGVLPPEVVPQLRYAVGVANRAIHGEPVDVAIALEAVDSADYGLRTWSA